MFDIILPPPPLITLDESPKSSTATTTDNTTTTNTTMSDLIEETTTVDSSTSNKRQRLSSTGDYNKKVHGSPVGSMAAKAMGTKKTTPTRSSSFAISSSTTTTTATNRNNGVVAVTGLDCTTSTTSTVTTPLPTFEKLAKELCKIVDTDHHSRDDAKRALVNVARWGYTGDDNSAFLSDFSELGGIQRVLLFLKNNQSDPSCVMVAMKVIMACTHRACDHPNYGIANEISRYFTMRNGIQILLNAGKEFINDDDDTNNDGGGGGDNDNDNDTVTSAVAMAVQQQLHALRWIWMVLMNVTEKTSTFEIVDKDQLLVIFDSFLETMTKLGLRNAATANAATTTTTTNNKMVVSPKKSVDSNSVGFTVQPEACGSAANSSLNIVQRAFSFCSPTASRKRSFIETTAQEQHPQGGRGGRVDTITSTTTATTTVDINKSKQEMEAMNNQLTSLVLEDMFVTLMNVTHNARMTRDDFQGMDLIPKCIGALKKPSGEWIDNNKELYIHASCFFVQCSKKNILSTKNDFEAAFPLIVECIRRYPEDSFKGELYDLVRNAYSLVNDKSFIQGSGIFGAVATVLQSHYVSEATKDASHQLLKELLD